MLSRAAEPSASDASPASRRRSATAGVASSVTQSSVEARLSATRAVRTPWRSAAIGPANS
jgi:hypothetical protein